LKVKHLKRLGLSTVLTAGLSVGMLATAPRLLADDHGDCERRVEHAEARLDQAIQKHGERSHEAEERRRDLNAERDRCWQKYHGWWNAHDKRWHTDRDWEQDHDRDQH